jgi:hypothetical protein
MNRNIASTLIVAGTAAAALALAAVATPVYADDITIDTTPFVSTKTRAEVQAEVMGQHEQLRMAYGEGSQTSQPFVSSLSRSQVSAEYIASRDEVHALNGEDSGSAFLTASRQSRHSDVIVAGSQR